MDVREVHSLDRKKVSGPVKKIKDQGHSLENESYTYLVTEIEHI